MIIHNQVCVNFCTSLNVFVILKVLLPAVFGMSIAGGTSKGYLDTISFNQLRNYPTCKMSALLMTACW